MRSLFSWINSVVNALATNYTLWFFGGLIALGAIAVFGYHALFPAMPQPAVYGSMHVPDQGWTLDEREKFYQTSQGNPVLPFTWFMSLERQPQGFPPYMGEVDLFSSPKVQARYGLLPDTSRFNPYLLPVGIVKDVLGPDTVYLLGQGHREWIGMSCAACHTGQILYNGRAVRIDGGQAMWNFSQWSQDMVSNLLLTSTLPSRFDRFAKRVFKYESKADTAANRRLLRKSMRTYLSSPLIKDALDAIFNHTYPVHEGNARTAALGRGVNGEFGLLDVRNIERNHGPVSFPPLWYTHDYDWVQSVAAIEQPMGRNITEAWGVNVQVELNIPSKRFISTARLENMYWMETLLSNMKAPQWPEAILGKIDEQKAERGRYLYEDAVWDQALTPEEEQLNAYPAGFISPPNPNRPTKGYCARCHAPVLQTAYDDPTFPNKYIQLPLYKQEVLDTDPYDAKEFNARNPFTGVLAESTFNGQTQVGIGEALTQTIDGIQARWYNDRNVSPRCRAIMNGFRANHFRAPLGYPARPLAGYWATGPFLHNGSVRTLYQLLSPVKEREREFYTGSFEFDPREVGYQNRRIDGAFLYKTGSAGNLNTGHEFRNAAKGTKGVIGPYLCPADRLAIVEYMKKMNDVEDSKIREAAGPARKTLLAAINPWFVGSSGLAGYEKPSMAQLCGVIVTVVDQLSSGENKTQSYVAGPSNPSAPPSTFAAEKPKP